MEFAYAILAKENLIVLRFAGDVTSQEHQEAMAGMRANKAYRPGMDVLVDLRGPLRSKRGANEILNEVFSLKGRALRLFGLFSSRSRRSGVRHALLVDPRTGGSIEAQLYQNLAAAQPDLWVRQFQDPQEAIGWLGLRRTPAFYLDQLPHP